MFYVSALKKLGMVSQHNILFCQNILYRNCIFQYIFPHFPANLTIFCSQFTIKCLGRGKNLGRVGKPETHIYFCLALGWDKQAGCVNGPGHAKTCLMPYANNKGADQPAHLRSLISIFVVHHLCCLLLR